ncbi:MAG: Transposase [Desulfotomaculum sp. 46_296]|nr:MAG: Transposase [Desulfotomaculum sp. 46_296]HAU32683.1 hypothetical protein [Desulfotomaculum sp.]
MIIDSTDIKAHEKPSREKSTSGASFGRRTASTGESKMYFGYKLYLSAVNTFIGPVPVAARVAPANCSDVDVDEEIAPKLMKETCDFHESVLEYKPFYYLLDAAYDSISIYIQAIEQ